MTAMTSRATRQPVYVENAIGTAPRDLVWKSSSLVDLYLARLRGALPMHHPQIEIMTRLVGTMAMPVERFLDLGSGDGILGAALLQHYPQAQGVLVDASEPMLQIARAKLQAYDGQLAFLPHDLGNHAWHGAVAPHGPFDVVVSGYAIHHLPDREKRQVYRAIHALLRPGGWFINIEYVAAPNPAAEELFMGYLTDQAYAAEARQGGTIGWAQVRDVIENLMHTPDDRPAPVEEQCGWLGALGFTDVDCYFRLFGFAVFGGRR